MQVTSADEHDGNVITRHKKRKVIAWDEKEDERAQSQGEIIDGVGDDSGGVEKVSEEVVQVEDMQMENEQFLGKMSDIHGDTNMTSKNVETVKINSSPESSNPELEFILSLE